MKNAGSVRVKVWNLPVVLYMECLKKKVSVTRKGVGLEVAYTGKFLQNT